MGTANCHSLPQVMRANSRSMELAGEVVTAIDTSKQFLFC